MDRDAQPLEPPLGYSVDALEPCGEAHEVAASLSAIERTTAVTAPSSAVRLGGEDVDTHGAWEGLSAEPASPPSPTAAAHQRLAELLPQITIRRRPLR